MSTPSFYASSKERSEILGSSAASRKLIQQCRQYAQTNAPVLLFGPPGCEFEKVAAFIHHCSDRANQPLVRQRSISWQDIADPIRMVGSGTLFVEGIQHASLPAQLRLLTELDETRLACYQADGSVPIPPRIVVSTSEDLYGLVDGGLFLEDLHWQICGLTVEIPSLHERSEDTPAIAQQMLDQGEVLGPCDRRFVISESCGDLLRSYSWPGNYRQLQSLLQRVVSLSTTEQLTILPDDLQHCARQWQVAKEGNYRTGLLCSTAEASDSAQEPVASNSRESISFDSQAGCEQPNAGQNLKGLDLNQLVQAVVDRGIVEAERNHRESHSFIVDRIEKALIAAVLSKCEGVQKTAAQKLGINRNTLHKKIKDYGLE